MAGRKPNLIFVFGDQWRAQALGYAGDPNVETPRLDAFRREAIAVEGAVSGCPVCSPYRASLLTGQYPLSHGMLVNDQSLRGNPVSFADAFNAAGYQTLYIGKWHIDGQGRRAFVPPERRLGFGFWRGFECTHDYNCSPYYADENRLRTWPGYDAWAQTDMLRDFIESHARMQPYAAFLSWGPPHNPYDTAPAAFRALYDPAALILRGNVPPEIETETRRDLAGYYAHCSALDHAFGRLLDALARTGDGGNTVVVFTSDHGDMLGSHGLTRKQHPYDESVCVPFLVRHPDFSEKAGSAVQLPLNAPDIMPTLLSLCGVNVPETVEGRDFADDIRHGIDRPDDDTLLAGYRPFHEWRYEAGARDYRGLRNARYTYVRDGRGPWLLFDRRRDPLQLRNLAGDPGSADLVRSFDARLERLLQARGDPFADGDRLAREYAIRLNDAHDVWTPQVAAFAHRGQTLSVSATFMRLPEFPVIPFAYCEVELETRAGTPGYLFMEFLRDDGFRNYADHCLGLPASADWTRRRVMVMCRHDAVAARLVLLAPGGTVEARNIGVRPVSPEEVLNWADGIYEREPPIGPIDREGRDAALGRTLRTLRAGGRLRMVSIGDSVANDLFNAHVNLLLSRQWPGTAIDLFQANGPEQSPKRYLAGDVLERRVAPLEPDLLVVAGMSHGGDVEALRNLAETVHAGMGCEILFAPASINFSATNAPEAMASFVSALRASIRDLPFAILDLVTPMFRYMESSPHTGGHYKRDRNHCNEVGKQILGRMFAAYLGA